MLDFQTKQNENGDPAQFLNTQHDAAEFNSTNEELKNAVLSGRQTLTDLVDYATENKTALGRSIIANSGYTLKIDSYNGGSKTLVLVPHDSNTIMPDFSTMDFYTFRFYVENEGLPLNGVDNLTVLGTTLPIASLSVGKFFKTIKNFTLYTFMYIQGVDRFVLVDESNHYTNELPESFTPTVSLNGPSGSTPGTFYANYIQNGKIISIDYHFSWTAVSGSITSIQVNYPTVKGLSIQAVILNSGVLPINIIAPFKKNGVFSTIYGTINLANIIFAGSDNPIFSAPPTASEDYELNFQAKLAYS